MKLEYGEQCFGSFIRVDGVDLNREEKNIKELKEIDKKISLILEELFVIRQELNADDWATICQIITNNENNEFKYIEEESNLDKCEQCGNWNNTEVYVK